jgi:hypothetical protein
VKDSKQMVFDVAMSNRGVYGGDEGAADEAMHQIGTKFGRMLLSVALNSQEEKEKKGKM